MFYSLQNISHEKQFILFFSFLCGSQFLSAQSPCTVSHDNVIVGSGNISAEESIGQTFIACQTGDITQISFELALSTDIGTNREFRLASSPTVPTAIISGAALETFSTVNDAQTITITLASPFAVTAGQTYAFELRMPATPVDGTSMNFANCSPCNYPDGNRYFATSSFVNNQTNFDLNFEVEICPSGGCPVGSPADVPTLSEWGLLILALLLMTLGTVYLLQPSLEQEC